MTRFEFIAAGFAAAAASPEKPKVAVVLTEYRPMSHADVIITRMLEGYMPNGIRVEPRTKVVSMYTDQVPEKDMSRALAAKHGFTIYPTVREALTRGTGKLAVDAILLIGEHGNYPVNERGQKLYPRYELFQSIAEVVRESGRAVPLFSDKHLSWSWKKADEMYRTARALKLPFMAGSSIPVTIRIPELELPAGCEIEHAVAAGYGDSDAYGFHTLEGLQCMVERRKGGESGIRSVQWLQGDQVWRWRDGEGSWSAPLLSAALATGGRAKPGRPEDNCKRPVLFLLEYNDGLRCAAYLLEGHVSEFEFAAQLRGRKRPLATRYVNTLDGGRPLPHFDALVKCIENLFVSGKPVYPVERTLLTTGALSFLFESKATGSPVSTPQLAIRYRTGAHTWFERS